MSQPANIAALAPTRADARALADRIVAEGHHARVVSNGTRHGVIAHAPVGVFNLACDLVGVGRLL